MPSCARTFVILSAVGGLWLSACGSSNTVEPNLTGNPRTNPTAATAAVSTTSDPNIIIDITTVVPPPNPSETKSKTWDEQDPKDRSLDIADIPDAHKPEYVELGLALELTNGKAGSTIWVRSTSGVMHASDALAPSHLASINGKLGDKVTIELCTGDVPATCTELGKLQLGNNLVIVASIDDSTLRRFEAFDTSDPKMLLSKIPASLQPDVKSYIETGFLKRLGKPLKPVIPTS